MQKVMQKAIQKVMQNEMQKEMQKVMQKVMENMEMIVNQWKTSICVQSSEHPGARQICLKA